MLYHWVYRKITVDDGRKFPMCDAFIPIRGGAKILNADNEEVIDAVSYDTWFQEITTLQKDQRDRPIYRFNDGKRQYAIITEIIRCTIIPSLCPEREFISIDCLCCRAVAQAVAERKLRESIQRGVRY